MMMMKPYEYVKKLELAKKTKYGHNMNKCRLTI